MPDSRSRQGHQRVHEQWAHLRFAVVGWLLAAPPEKGELRAAITDLAQRTWQHPTTGEPVQFGFSTIERWYYRAVAERTDPVGVLRRKVRCNAGQQHTVSDAVRRAVLAQYAAHKGWSVQLHHDNLVALAETQPDLKPVPSYPTLRRFMRANGLDKRRRLTPRTTRGAEQAEARIADREIRSYESEYVNALWHWDCHHCSRKVLTARGEWVTPILFGVLDDRSRLACHLQWYLAETAEVIAHGLSQAFQKRGLPRAALSDATERDSGASEAVADDVKMAEIPLSSAAKVTVERRGQIVLIGLNRPYIHNRVDPETYAGLARAYYQYDHDSSLRAAVLFGHGDNFSRGIDVDAFAAIVTSGRPRTQERAAIDPLAKTAPARSKPLVVVAHGDTWNMGHELLLAADIRVAAADTRFGQDETSHGRFPGGGATIRFVREAGWGNAMRYMLTGDHWGADEAFRMGVVQEIAPTRENALEAGVAIATKIAACGPLGIKTTLASAHLAIDSSQVEAMSQLNAQYGALYGTEDFKEGRAAEAEGRQPIYQGK